MLLSKADRECRVCGETKPLTDEFFSSDRKHASRWFSRRCRTCDAAAARTRWRQSANAREMDKASRDARREEIRAYDRMRACRDRAKKAVIIARWIENNPERHRALSIAKSSRRRAKLKAAGGAWGADDVTRIMDAQAGCCWWCQKKLGPNYHVDHRFPISKDGTNDVSNIVISCAPCNQSKSTKMPWQFCGRLL